LRAGALRHAAAQPKVTHLDVAVAVEQEVGGLMSGSTPYVPPKQVRVAKLGRSYIGNSSHLWSGGLSNAAAEPKVAQLDVAVAVEQEVGGLDVAVQQLRAVHELEGLDQLVHDISVTPTPTRTPCSTSAQQRSATLANVQLTDSCALDGTLRHSMLNLHLNVTLTSCANTHTVCEQQCSTSAATDD
jgi:hypothetical protein